MGSRRPLVLHRVWIGEQCPPLLDVASLVVAKLLFRPERIIYHLGSSWTSAREQFSGERLARCGELLACWEALGVTRRVADYRALNLTDWVMQKRNEHISDAIRLHALNAEGGAYIDSDVFIINGSLLHRIAAKMGSSDFVMAADVEDMPDGSLNWRTPPGTSRAKANNGMMVAAPATPFGRAWWAELRHWAGRGWDELSCHWPYAQRQRYAGLRLDDSMRTVPWLVRPEWRATHLHAAQMIERVASGRPTASLHLAGHRWRQIAPKAAAARFATRSDAHEWAHIFLRRAMHVAAREGRASIPAPCARHLKALEAP